MSTEPKAEAPPANTAADAVKAMAAIIALPTVAALAFADNAMNVGAPVQQVTGGTGLEVVGRPNSSFFQDVMVPGLLVAGTFALVQALSTPPPTPEQERAIAEEAQKKAELAQQDALKQENLTEEDARKVQAGLEEERRKAYFANKGPG